MIHLSASSIADYLVCSRKWFYRSTQGEQAETSQDMAVGSAVHLALEKNWKNKQEAFAQVDNLCKLWNVDPRGLEKAKLAVDTFFTMDDVISSLGNDDLIEYQFREKLPGYDDVYLQGKMDRVIKDMGIVYDWKTTTKPKKQLVNDIQANIYYYAYKKIFHKEPIVYMVYLYNGKAVSFAPSVAFQFELINVIIPKMIGTIRRKEFAKEGYFNGACYNCQFSGICR